MSADAQMIAGWWREFVDSGRPPAGLVVVQQRLVRSVLRGELPSGPVHLKLMAFPRAKDRLRYSLRALPAAHEARLLTCVRAAGICCPEVLAVHTRRRFGLPSHSLLVLRTLPVVAESAPPAARFAAEAALAARLLAAGIVHPDLHGENFVRLADGRLAVLDLQSARTVAPAAAAAARWRLPVAARLLRATTVPAAQALLALMAASLVRDEQERAAVVSLAAREAARFERSRVLRCLQESTEFERRVGLAGVEHRLRGELPPGRWMHGGARLREAWIGQRALQLRRGRAPVFRAFFRKWWWLGGGAALYLPAACGDQAFQAEVQAAAMGYSLLPSRRGATSAQGT